MAEAVDDGRFSRTMEEQSDQIIDPWCELCFDDTGHKKEAGSFCTECNSFVCQSCVNDHKKIPTTRGHRILRGARMPQSQAEKPVRYHGCGTHAEHVNDHFCLDHGDMICIQCIEEYHQECSTLTIPKLCDELGSTDIQELKYLISKLSTVVNDVQVKLKKNISETETKRHEMIREAEDVRDRIITFAKTLCSDKTLEINKVCRQKADALSEKLTPVYDINDTLEEIISDIDKPSMSSILPNTFIQIQDLVERIRECKMDIENFTKTLGTEDLTFICKSEISVLLSSCNSIGKVCSLPKVFEVQAIPEIKFPNQAELRARIQKMRKQTDLPEFVLTKLPPLQSTNESDKDTEPCDIWGMDITKTGLLLLTDNNNCKVKLVSRNKQLLSSLILPSAPCDICIIDDMTVVVSAYDMKLYILDVRDPKSPSIQKSLPLGYLITGMFECQGNLAVTSWSGIPCVKLIDLNGKVLWSLATDSDGNRLFGTPRSVAIQMIDDKAIIVVSDPSYETLTAVDSTNGNVTQRIKMEGKRPVGITADFDGKVYICCNQTREVCVWTADLQQSRIILSGSQLHSKPKDILYSGTTDEIFVCYAGSNLVDHFRLV